jgi:Flp pilus assembly protein TadD
MAKALASLGQTSVAVTIAERGAQLTEHADPGVLDGLAAVYAAAGQTDRAVRTAERAIQLATQMGADDLARTIREHLRLYRQNRK